MKEELSQAIARALSSGTGMIHSAFRRKPLELPAPPMNPCKEISFPGSAQDIHPTSFKVTSIDPGDLFDFKTAILPQKTAAEVLAEQQQMEAFRANLQKQEAERALASRYRAAQEPMLKHLKALLKELEPTQLLLQSPHYTALAQLIHQIETAPVDKPQFDAYGAAMRQLFKEKFTG